LKQKRFELAMETISVPHWIALTVFEGVQVTRPATEKAWQPYVDLL